MSGEGGIKEEGLTPLLNALLLFCTSPPSPLSRQGHKLKALELLFGEGG